LEDIKWTGYLQALWVDSQGNIREDTVADNHLVPKEDKIIRYRFDDVNLQTIVDRYTDADGDGAIDNVDAEGNPVPDDSLLMEDYGGAMWEAGQQLALRDPADRQIITFADLNWDEVVTAGEQLEFTVGNVAQFEPYLDVIGDDPASYSYLGAAGQRATNLVQFIRGEQVSGLRNRQVTVNGTPRVWKLGDIVSSTPTVVTSPSGSYDLIYGDSTYTSFARHWRDRQGMVYIGANDGMLHAFRAGRFILGDDSSTAGQEEVGYFEETNMGSEAWAYVPFNLLPHLKWLADPDYTHVFYVDLKMRVMDVKIFQADQNVHIEGWGTLLIGGMKFGGGPYPSGMTDAQGDPLTYRSGYFLIDVTDPEDPEVLAEFTHPEMGFTTSYPAVTKVGDHWYLIVGSGPTPGSSAPYRYDGTSDQNARFFVLDLTQFMSTHQIREGQELHIFQGLVNSAFMGDPMSVDKPLDYSVDVIYVGETFWGSSKWQGRMYRLKTNGSTNPANWALSTLFSTDVHQPITAAPSATVGFGNNLLIYFGTGRFYNQQDRVDTNTQTFYGINDACMDGGSCDAVASGDLLDVTDAAVFTDQTMTGVSGADTFPQLEGNFRGASPSYSGWKMDLLDPGERSLSKPSILGGTVLFTTFIPNADICSTGGEGKLYGLYFLTGTAHYKPILAVDDDTNESSKYLLMGKGVPASLGIHVGSQGSAGFVQTSKGNIIQVDVDPPLKVKSGTTSWRQP
jgi:type IV pilus assembly protein PilY1